MKIFKVLSQDDKQNILFILLVIVLFYINEFIKFKVHIPYLGYFLKNYYNDFLGGFSFMALINIILLFSKYNKVKKLTTIMLIGILCSIFWEVVTPIFIISSTGDFFDVIAYCAGFSVYWILKKLMNKDITYII